MNAPTEEQAPPHVEDEAPPPKQEEALTDEQERANLPPVMPKLEAAPFTEASWDEKVPEELYHSDKTAVSSTGTKKILTDTPAHFFEAWSQPYDADEDDSSDALRLGTLLHLALLQPELYAKRVVLSQKFDRRTKEGKAAAAAFEKDLPDKAIICDKDEKERIEAMALSVLAHPIAGDLIRSKYLRKELTGYFTCPKSGVRCRIRLDGYEVTPDGARTIVDLKSIFRARLEDIRRAVENFKYANQAVTYVEGACIIDKIPNTEPPPIYAWIFIEKTAPYACRVFYPDAEMLADAQVERDAAMAKLAKCIRENKWPAYELDAQPLSRAAWARKRDNR